MLSSARSTKLGQVSDYEKLGILYLGRRYDPNARALTEAPVLLESQRLTTHAVCMGMTGSGKTGLCISLLEEAALDGIPVLAIDPKGDLSNLLLTFPELDAAALSSWVDPAEAERRGLSVEALAGETAERMTRGLAESGQTPERIARLKSAADFAIYTPGSSAGLSLSIARSLEAPAAALRDDEELFRERVQATVSGLLGLLDLEADPLQSREHILVSRILSEAFARGESLSLAVLLARIKAPPFREVGVLDLESFYPEKERMKLVLALNNLLASPAFASWLSGEPLDIQSLLYTAQGKPRVSVLSIAHLDDKQRMFFVTLLLNEVLAWTRAQAGTSSLRALLYMDEVFGYFPPVREPPSKRPMLTLLKQARAFGLGLVLATQNPVDLDYKGLSNIGTWFIGRLQTERDRARVLDGMEGAASSAGASFERGRLDTQLAALAPRMFVLHSARGGAPELFGSRQALSFLRGPLTRSEIKRLMDPRKASAAAEASAGSSVADTARVASAPVTQAAPTPVAQLTETSVACSESPPTVPSGIEVVFVPRTGAGTATSRYVPTVLAVIKLVAPARTLLLHTPIEDAAIPVQFERATELTCAVEQLARTPEPGIRFVPLPPAALDKKRYAAWGKEALALGLERAATVRFKSPSTKLESEPGESERDFRARVLQCAREKRDEKVQALRDKYDEKLRTARQREQRLAAQVAREQSQASAAKVEGMVDVGSAILGAFFGKSGVKKADVMRAGKAVRGVSRASKEGADVERAEVALAELTARRQAIEAELADAVQALATPPVDEVLETKLNKPRKADAQLVFVGLAFVCA
ncbi:MAG: hypothetical protein JWN48_5578 [Myxococcaceae bacterium]|nr:hypothetical protein [Myxococcaceae bacterium]